MNALSEYLIKLEVESPVFYITVSQWLLREGEFARLVLEAYLHRYRSIHYKLPSNEHMVHWMEHDYDKLEAHVFEIITRD